MSDVRDLRYTIIPKSDQLNSEQLLGSPIIVHITHVTAGGGADQPLSVHYEGENGRPYKPCKTMRKVLIHAWGSNGTEWVGRSLELYNDPSIKFGGETVGGIRISRMTDIHDKGIRVSLTATRGKKALHTIELLRFDPVETPSEPIADAHTIAIQQAETLEELKTAFSAAQSEARNAKDAGRLSRYVQLKEERKASLDASHPNQSDQPENQ